jgi:hypothetical protein
VDDLRVSEAIYLYGFVPPDTVLPPNGLIGTAEAVVELLNGSGFQAVIARVPGEAYEAGAIEAQLQDLAWVAAQGVAHERVVAWFVDHAQIVPVPLFTLYSAVDALTATMNERTAVVRTQLQRFRGFREWDLKVSYRADQAEAHAADLSPQIAQLDDEIANASAGRRFLLEKKRKDIVRAEVAGAAADAANALLDEVRPLCRELVVAPLPRVATELPVVANAALLVHAEQELALRDRVRERAEHLRPIGIEVTYSGPWAPYRFVDQS